MIVDCNLQSEPTNEWQTLTNKGNIWDTAHLLLNFFNIKPEMRKSS